MSQTHTRRYGLIGSGMMGFEHIMNVALVEGCELVALADPHGPSRDQAQMIVKGTGQTATSYARYQDMLDIEDLDAVIIASPNFTHHQVVQDVMAYPVAILVEKPLCTTIDDAAHIARLAQSHDHMIWTGLEYRYMPPVARFIEDVHSGVTGPVNMVSIREHRFPFLPKVGDWNRFSRNTGGTLVEKCCHFFDLMRVILRDDPVRIYATGAQDVNHLDERYDGEVPDILDNAYVLVDFRSGARAVLDLCMFAEGAQEQEEIYALGATGRLDVKIPSAMLTWSPRNRRDGYSKHIETPKAALEAGHHHGATFYQLTEFHQALISRQAPLVSAVDGYKSVVMGALAHQSIETGQAVDIVFEDFGL